ncbi:AUGMIN subunit 1-like [Phalaenopsis equestris]|uniref:AUGMIN subunit 1-like n=1 Tax=Phalaenopsis equestris TaxID=78828 RepID=UPI0009E501F5|nr:AUGMIN subunit 1-like [Phalaenopsis equestris]
MEVVGDRFPALHSPAISVNSSGWNSDAVRITEVKSWLSSQFEAAGREVPEFEYTPRSVSQLHALATLSQSRSRAASIVADDLRLKAAEYRAQAARIREVLDSAGLSQERLTPDAVSSVQVVASVANLLNIRDTESSRSVHIRVLNLRVLRCRLPNWSLKTFRTKTMKYSGYFSG